MRCSTNRKASTTCCLTCKADDKYVDSYSDTFRLKEESLFPIPMLKKRFTMYVTGVSGVGKSVFTSQCCDMYHEYYPDNQIILISLVPFDDEEMGHMPTFDPDYVQRVKLEYATLNVLDPKTFTNSLFVFDDTDSIFDKDINSEVRKLKEMILETGRHTNTSIIITTHMFNNYHKTRIVLNECNQIVLFPRMLWSKPLRRAIEGYIGVDAEHIELIKKFSKKSRWCYISKEYPQHVVYSDGFLSLSGQ